MNQFNYVGKAKTLHTVSKSLFFLSLLALVLILFDPLIVYLFHPKIDPLKIAGWFFGPVIIASVICAQFRDKYQKEYISLIRGLME